MKWWWWIIVVKGRVQYTRTKRLWRLRNHLSNFLRAYFTSALKQPLLAVASFFFSWDSQRRLREDGRLKRERPWGLNRNSLASSFLSLLWKCTYIFFICTSLVFQPIDFLLESPCSSLLDANLHQLMISGCMRETASRDWKLKLGPLMVSTLLIKKHRIKTL